ncbi:hypothetical protein BU26DRAFT_512152 [Trematosphaeria pertusa]|uniref:Uncharacterized protein n=1 Tax=Trematosphaeria pertusa TaxID=390896 RepID=A0A6A6HSE9_9PLEO|nr:uncharacterized protein BU26DRAFT_512152 [Trematosphaeria pertusa]KAF2240708.1 hypothetical protein BU26DRAFT_512152 [Trematosphaeria pertusa]
MPWTACGRPASTGYNARSNTHIRRRGTPAAFTVLSTTVNTSWTALAKDHPGTARIPVPTRNAAATDRGSASSENSECTRSPRSGDPLRVDFQYLIDGCTDIDP